MDVNSSAKPQKNAKKGGKKKLEKIIEHPDVCDTQHIVVESDIIEDDDTKESDNEQSISLNQKKKKNSGIRFRIQKKCKNINNYYTEGDDFEKDILDEFEIKELSYELEVL